MFSMRDFRQHARLKIIRDRPASLTRLGDGLTHAKQYYIGRPWPRFTLDKREHVKAALGLRPNETS